MLQVLGSGFIVYVYRPREHRLLVNPSARYIQLLAD